MMTGIIANAWKNVKPHVPLIKFRKGGSQRGQAGKPTSVSSAPAPKSSKVGSPSTSQQPVIEDWQLPPRYRRQLLDDAEINAINSGGAY